MSAQIIFFDKSLCDYGSSLNVNPNGTTASASQASDLAYLVQDRSNRTAWITTGSVDADNTWFLMDLGDTRTITEILLIKHNFKNYLIQYWDGANYVDLVTVTNSVLTTSRHTVSSTLTSRIKITITGTQVANADKFLYQLILTTLVGQLTGWPIIDAPTHERNRQTAKMLSGKTSLSVGLGAFSCSLKVAIWKDSNDLAIVESLFDSSEGVLVWLCGGDENQFSSKRKGYRLEDIYLMRAVSDYQPQWAEGIYSNGLVIDIDLAEVTR